MNYLINLGRFNLFKPKAEKEALNPYYQESTIIPILKRQKFLYRVDVSHWRFGQEEALDIYRPRRITMQEVYFDALLDSHLQTVLQSRLLNVLNTPFKVVDENGEEDEQLTRLLKKRWFYKYLGFVMESKFHGYSVIALKLKNGVIYDTASIPRENVIPDHRAVLTDINSDDCVYIDQNPYSNLYTFVGDTSFGLINECARYTIFKKQAINLWSQYQELFGIPYRVGKYRGNDKRVMDRMEQHLRDMGSAAYGLFPSGAEIELITTGQTDGHNVFKAGAEFSNLEISKRVLGQTMTTENGSSRSQAEVHMDKERDLAKADFRFVQFEINDNFFPLLMRWGVPLQNRFFEFDLSKKLPLAQDQLSVDTFLAQYFDLEGDYIERTYGVPVKIKEKQPVPLLPTKPNEEPEEDKQEDTTKKDKNKPVKTSSLFTAQLRTEEYYAKDNSLFAVFTRLAKSVFTGTMKGVIDNGSYTYYNEEFQTAIKDAFGKDIIKFKKGSPERKLYEQLLFDAKNFAAHKSYRVVNELKALAQKFNKTGEEEFLTISQKIHNTQNGAYLQTEFNAFVATTQNAEQFLSYQKDKDIFPYLRFQTVGDDRVRKEHKVLNGITLPIDHPFFDTHIPPLDHECRCELVQETKGARVTHEDKLKDLPNLPAEFAHNTAKTGRVYTDKHPYYQDVADSDKKKIEKFIKDN